MEQNKNTVKLNLNGNDYKVPQELSFAILNMMKFMVSNEWYDEVSDQEMKQWLQTGTGLSIENLNALAQNEKLFDRTYVAGTIHNPFHDTIEKIEQMNAKRKIEDKTR